MKRKVFCVFLKKNEKTIGNFRQIIIRGYLMPVVKKVCRFGRVMEKTSGILFSMYDQSVLLTIFMPALISSGK
jgi:hypothetical protein